jgi:DNA-directed RNA polymerase subunit M/transcription elongation factor TFIIS
MRFCPVCAYYLFLQDQGAGEESGPVLQLFCRHCGYSEKMEPKSSKEALVLETTFSATAAQKQTESQLNDYTKLDPTLPRLKTIPCPNPECPTQAEPDRRDILYIKTDAKNLKYQYCCSVCNTQWGS